MSSLIILFMLLLRLSAPVEAVPVEVVPQESVVKAPQTATTIGTAIICDENGVIYEWRDGDWQPTGEKAW